MPVWLSTSENIVYKQDHRRLDIGSARVFWSYYLRRRGVHDELLTRLSDGLRSLVSESLAREVLAELQDAIQQNDLLGQLGEVVASFVMEEQEDVLLCHVNWPNQPFAVVRGLDLAGLCTETWLPVVIEIKATASAQLSAQASKLTDDLRDSRVRPKLDLPIDTGRSRRSILARFRRALQEGQFGERKIAAEDVERMVGDDAYVRVGILIHPRRENGKYDYKRYIMKLRNDDFAAHCPSKGAVDDIKECFKLPTVFLDLDIIDIHEAFLDWMRLEAFRDRRV